PRTKKAPFRGTFLVLILPRRAPCFCRAAHPLNIVENPKSSGNSASIACHPSLLVTSMVAVMHRLVAQNLPHGPKKALKRGDGGVGGRYVDRERSPTRNPRSLPASPQAAPGNRGQGKRTRDSGPGGCLPPHKRRVLP